MAAKIVNIELSEPLLPVWGMERYDKLYALVRYHGDVLGWMTVGNTDHQSVVPVAQLRRVLTTTFTWPLSQALLRRRLTTGCRPATLPPISVIVCSQGRPVQLAACLSALRAMDYPEFEVLVVAPFPGDDTVAQTARRFEATYSRSEFRGIDAARNHAINLAKHDIVAFTIDHARPDRFWLKQLGLMFSDRDVNAVTGLVAPAELETLAQHHQEFTFGYGYKLQPAIFEKSRLTTSECLWSRHFGSGANMAFRRNLLAQMGGFNAGLSADSGGEGSGDLYLLHRLIVAGHVLHYQPNAIVWLTHERYDRALRRRMNESGRYIGAYLLVCFRNHTEGRSAILKFFFRSWIYERLLKRIIKPQGIPRYLVFQELLGTLTAPAAYLKGRALARKGKLLLPPVPASTLRSQQTKPPQIQVADPLPGSIPIRIIRTWYPHWGNHAGINQYIKYLDQQRFHVSEHLVRENDEDFPIHSETVRVWLRHRVKREGMSWYNLSDFAAELRTVSDYLTSRAALLHYLDGEHAAQFLPPRRRAGARPATIVTYHQPPDVLMRVVRMDVAQRYDCITVVSPEQEEFFRSHVGSTPVRLTLHGIDTEYYHPASRLQPQPSLRCITVGHNYRDYEAVKSVAERLRTVPGLEFHVVSPRPTGLDGLPNVRSYRGVSDEQLVRLYQDSDILFLPLTQATANNSLLEGMACGLPVISTDLFSIRVYTGPSAAILVENNDPGRLADALVYLMEDSHIRSSMASAARRKAEQLDWRNVAPSFASVYSEFVRR